MIRNIIKLGRYWLLKQLFNDDEKYLIIRALEDRYDKLSFLSINEKWINKKDVKDDCSEYTKLKKIFSTEFWR